MVQREFMRALLAGLLSDCPRSCLSVSNGAVDVFLRLFVSVGLWRTMQATCRQHRRAVPAGAMRTQRTHISRHVSEPSEAPSTGLSQLPPNSVRALQGFVQLPTSIFY